jgi:hypothetical protein
MKTFIILLFELTSFLAHAGVGGIAGGTSASSISLDKLKSYLKSPEFIVNVPQIPFSNEQVGTVLVSVDSVCHRADYLETVKPIFVSSDNSYSSLQVFMFERPRFTRQSAERIIPLNHQITFYRKISDRDSVNSKKFLGTRVYTIPDCTER